jgi:hypothetical protein
VNPLLAAHMGRWAEVYFTNPPEKREQAVSELLRELENVSPLEGAPRQAIPDERAKIIAEMVESPNAFPAPFRAPFPATLEDGLRCSACAYHNSPGQNFCGMCGTPLEVLPETYMPRVGEAAPVVGGSWSESSVGTNWVESASEDVIEPAGRDRDYRELTWLRPQKDFPDFAAESEPPSSYYRFYVGTAVVILLVVVGYMAWRGTEALSGAAGSQPAPSRAVPAAQPAPVVSTPPSPTPGAATNPMTSAVLTGAPPDSPAQHQSQPESRSPKQQAVVSRPAPRIVSMAAGSSPLAPETSSAEDLATAEKYLNGNQGVPRDRGEAVRWLWKAEGKGNLEATLVLADLFLRGDVRLKNCSQARVLLDAAAKKGSKAAGERLRNLQAFGCQ